MVPLLKPWEQPPLRRPHVSLAVGKPRPVSLPPATPRAPIAPLDQIWNIPRGVEAMIRPLENRWMVPVPTLVSSWVGKPYVNSAPPACQAGPVPPEPDSTGCAPVDCVQKIHPPSKCCLQSPAAHAIAAVGFPSFPPAPPISAYLLPMAPLVVNSGSGSGAGSVTGGSVTAGSVTGDSVTAGPVTEGSVTAGSVEGPDGGSGAAGSVTGSVAGSVAGSVTGPVTGSVTGAGSVFSAVTPAVPAGGVEGSV